MMAKLGLTKLGLKKNTNLMQLKWNDQIIEIKEYLPIQEKLDLIGRIVNQSLDDNNFVNPARLQIFMTLEIFYAYTNINFTDKQKEDFLGLYDLLISSGLYKEIFNKLYEIEEFQIIDNTCHAVIDEVYKYKNSALGILQTISTDYSNLDLNADKIKEKIANKENVEFLKEVMDKMG